MKIRALTVLAVLAACVLPASAALVTFDFYTVPTGTFPFIDVTADGVTLRVDGFDNTPANANVNNAYGGLGVIGSGSSALNPPRERLTFRIINPGLFTQFSLYSVQFGRGGGTLDGDDMARIAFPATALPSIDVAVGDLTGAVWMAGTPIGLTFPHTNPQVSIRAIGPTEDDVFRVGKITLQAVPEPGTYALVGFGLIGLALIRRRRRA